jgi:polyhydroxyalkanoate synthase subunit PhaC
MEDVMSAVALVHARDAITPPETRTEAVAATAEKPAADTAFRVLDRRVHAAVSQATLGLSPAALAGAFFDWYVHLTGSPGKRLDLARQAIDGAVGDWAFAIQSASGLGSDPSTRALPHDERFRAPAWQSFPFNVYAHNFLSIERWWEAATRDVRGVSHRHDEMADFTALGRASASSPTISSTSEAPWRSGPLRKSVRRQSSASKHRIPPATPAGFALPHAIDRPPKNMNFAPESS